MVAHLILGRFALLLGSLVRHGKCLLRGNDLSTPRGGFPGLKVGDRWALCAPRQVDNVQMGHSLPLFAGGKKNADLTECEIRSVADC